MKSSDFISQVKGALSKTISGGLLTCVDEGRSDSFGNAWVEFLGDGYAIRFVRDRGEVSFEARNAKSNQWWPVDFLCELANCSTPDFDLSSNLDAFFQLLPVLSPLIGNLGYPLTSEKLEEIADKRRERQLSEMNPRPNQ